MAEHKSKTITFVGQSQSGKTNLLSALLNNDNACADLEFGPEPIYSPSIRSTASPDSLQGTEADYLTDHYVGVLRGRDDMLEGTNDVRTYPCRMQYSWAKKTKPLFGAERTEMVEETIDFDIVDGRGGDVAPTSRIEQSDTVTIEKRAAYRDGMDASTGHVIFMPMLGTEFDQNLAQRFRAELHEALKRKARSRDATPLQNISLCFTKYDRHFVDDGSAGFHHAIDKEDFKRTIQQNALLGVFRPILEESKRGDFDVRIFPVSTFGFVKDSGIANFYPYEHAPGLLTRAVDEFDDYDDPNLPDYKDHFPFPVRQNDAASLWEPFNIAAPILFALTGRVAGHISLSAQEALGEGAPVT